VKPQAQRPNCPLSHRHTPPQDANLNPAHVRPQNKLYYGDNLEVLRDYIPDQSADLIYLDPPFNFRQDYNVLFAAF
jgi:16S rRNA G966 N2-methylase RsmD